MKRFILATFVFALIFFSFVVPAQARGFGAAVLGFDLGVGAALACCGYYPYYSPYYSYPGYYAPPPAVVYAQPAPPPVTYVVPQSLPATQAAPAFVDGQGRTCRKFQSVLDGASVSGTACLQADGTWHTVAE
jgi:hypothetical protein